MGAGSLSLRSISGRCRSEAAVRSLLHQEPHALSRYADSVRDRRRGPARQPEHANILVALAVAVVAWGLAAHVLWALNIRLLADAGRMMTLDLLAAAILGLIVVEQVFRNVADESRWTVTPLCLG